MTTGYTLSDHRVVGNVTDNARGGAVNGALDAIVISREGAVNVGRTVTVKIDVAPGFAVTFGPLAVGNADVILHPRKQAVAADLSTLVAGVYERWHISGKITVTTSGCDTADVTRVRVITES